VGFPHTSLRHNVILFIVDKLTKSSHCIPVRDTYDVIDVAHVFISEFICLHQLPKNIILLGMCYILCMCVCGHARFNNFVFCYFSRFFIFIFSGFIN
jgi:hypothetical protein